ncbi:MAG: hypothetical protein QG657_5611 [Acidobacteriota bacterium]|nr:hypothetical protein [Acidobacteriota bacterium]
MINRLKFEFSRIFNVIHIPLFILFFIASLYLLNDAIIEFNQGCESNNIISSLEKQKSTQTVTYEQYGVLGYRIISDAEPVIIFFNYSTPLNSLESKIDCLESVNIGSSAKGKEIFKNKSYFKDLFGLLNVFGSLLLCLIGLFSYKPRAVFMTKKASPLKMIITRLIWLNMYFIVSMTALFFFAMMKGMPFTKAHTTLYLGFELETIMFLNVCFIIGYTIAASFKTRHINISLTIIAWFFCIFILPEFRYPDIQEKDVLSVSKIDLIKNETLMSKEKSFREAILPLLKDPKKNPKEAWDIQKRFAMEYLNDSFTTNNALEYKLQEQMKTIIDRYERNSLWNPFSFNLLTGESLSGRDYRYYEKFTDHVLVKKDRFFRYYIDKRYNSKDETVIPITGDDDFIYKSKSVLPDMFWQGIAIQFLYLAVFIIISQVVIFFNGYKKSKAIKPLDLNQLKNSRTFFWECKESDGLEEYLNYFDTIADLTLIDSREISASGVDTPLIHWIDYTCKQKKYNRQDSLARLETLGISQKELKKTDVSLKPENIKRNAEKLKMVYLVLKTMENSSLYVIFNLFKGETQEFEDTCKKYLAGLGKMVLYISNEPFRQRVLSSKLIKGIDIYDEIISLR